MLAIARALLTGPEPLLDEPSQGLAPLVVEAVVGTIRQLKSERVSMLLVEQNAEMALALADRVYVIDHGTIVFEGTPAGLRGSGPRQLEASGYHQRFALSSRESTRAATVRRNADAFGRPAVDVISAHPPPKIARYAEHDRGCPTARPSQIRRPGPGT